MTLTTPADLSELQRDLAADPANYEKRSAYLRALERARQPEKRRNIIEAGLLIDIEANSEYKRIVKILKNEFPDDTIYLVGGQIFRRIIQYYHGSGYLGVHDWDFLIGGCAHHTVNIFHRVHKPKNVGPWVIKERKYINNQTEDDNTITILNHSKSMAMPKTNIGVDIISGCDIHGYCFEEPGAILRPPRRTYLLEEYFSKVPLNFQKAVFNVRTKKFTFGQDIVHRTPQKYSVKWPLDIIQDCIDRQTWVNNSLQNNRTQKYWENKKIKGFSLRKA